MKKVKWPNKRQRRYRQHDLLADLVMTSQHVSTRRSNDPAFTVPYTQLLLRYDGAACAALHDKQERLLWEVLTILGLPITARLKHLSHLNRRR